MGNLTGIQPKDGDGTNQSGGIIVIAQGLTTEPIELSFPMLLPNDAIQANIVAESGKILHHLRVKSPIMDFSNLFLPSGNNKLVVRAGEIVREAII